MLSNRVAVVLTWHCVNVTISAGCSSVVSSATVWLLAAARCWWRCLHPADTAVVTATTVHCTTDQHYHNVTKKFVKLSLTAVYLDTGRVWARLYNNCVAMGWCNAECVVATLCGSSSVRWYRNVRIKLQGDWLLMPSPPHTTVSHWTGHTVHGNAGYRHM